LTPRFCRHAGESAWLLKRAMTGSVMRTGELGKVEVLLAAWTGGGETRGRWPLKRRVQTGG
jgi:hypothetical protein